MTIQKWGSGKTTTAKNLGVTLARQGKRVLMIDLDLQGNLSLSLVGNSWIELSKTDSASELFNLESTRTIEELVHGVEGLPNMHVILANPHRIFEQRVEEMNTKLRNEIGAKVTELEIADTVEQAHKLAKEMRDSLGDYSKSARNWERILAKRLAPIQEQYDYIIIDLPPTVDKIPMNAWVASHYLLVPIADWYGVQGAAGLIDHLTEIYKEHNENLRFVFFFNRMGIWKNGPADTSSGITKQSLDLVTSFLGAYSQSKFLKDNSLVMTTLIPESKEIAKSSKKYGGASVANEKTYADFANELEGAFSQFEQQ